MFSAQVGTQGNARTIFFVAALHRAKLVFFEKTVLFAAFLYFLHMLAALLSEDGGERLGSGGSYCLDLVFELLHLILKMLFSFIENA